LVPTCTCHVDGTSGISTQYFLPILPTQWVKSSTQNQNLWWIVAKPFKSNHKPSLQGLGMPRSIIYFFSNDYCITMFQWVSLNCKIMNIRRC
jgi:hypothetical protein